jgi:RHS repeat-associated protein
LQEQYDYDAFGFPYFYTAGGGTLTAPPRTRFLFTGREWLSELRIYDYRARQYQPELGRFLQPDPKEFAAGDYNIYRYCHNDPVNHTDPMGLKPIDVEEDVDKKSREGLTTVRDIMKKSGDGMERAKSTGRDPKDGKVFLGEPTEKGKPNSKGGQSVEIPGPGRGVNPESGVHAHPDNNQTDGNGKVLPPGKVGPIASNGDRRWSDQEQRPIYTISGNGQIVERYRPDDSGVRNGGVTERWNGHSWDPLRY